MRSQSAKAEKQKSKTGQADKLAPLPLVVANVVRRLPFAVRARPALARRRRSCRCASEAQSRRRWVWRAYSSRPVTLLAFRLASWLSRATIHSQRLTKLRLGSGKLNRQSMDEDAAPAGAGRANR